MITIANQTVLITPTGPVEPRDKCRSLTHGDGTLVAAGIESAILVIGGIVTVCPVEDVRAIVSVTA